MDDPETGEEIAGILGRMASLDTERAELRAKLERLERSRAPLVGPDRQVAMVADTPTVTAASSTKDKVALFRRLFAGRPDVFPVRCDNQKSGRSGYAPACANEWVKGACGKPQVKCGERSFRSRTT